MKLSILIPTLPERFELFQELTFNLQEQARNLGLEADVDYEIIPDPRPRPTLIGAKRNALLDLVKGEYLCFFDDDDEAGDNYMERVFEGIAKGVDCVSLRGEYYENGKLDGIFEHSLKYGEWKTTDNEIKYERYPNHLNVIKSSIAKQFKFPLTNHGEDHNWSTQVFKSGLVKSEHYVDEVIYKYMHISNK